ncbi:aminomethyltransferase family protein [Roseospira goensis]|uniref:Aminomethyltransferase n=1 Tax=Roseospira goensis TaxID=391922 RepID=A0A7W6WIM3_9PROT|nr:aminomethyltransferase family protein [Roseospira goensis]MBB4284386.1 aminomethyltransferase [Roseospira goensis]
MSDGPQTVSFAVLPLPSDAAGSGTEFARTLAAHPLVHQELPYDPQYTVYNRRLTALRMTSGSAEDAYWRLRRHVILRHTGELPIEVRGPDAVRLLDLVFTRDVAKTRVGRCSYQIACLDDGGMIMDGVLVRLAEDRFWYGQADGDLTLWLKAQARGLDVAVVDPGVWVSQVQGPDSLRVLEAAVDGPYPDPFRYFDAARVRIAGQDVVITRTGFTNELGWEVYLEPGGDTPAVGDRILDAGRPYGLTPVAVGGARRIEAGLLNAGSDFDETVTPFAAGLGSMVDLDKPAFIGKAALQCADTRSRTWGLRVPGGVARLGLTLETEGAPAGRVCSSAWSPFLGCGVAIVRLDEAGPGPGTPIAVVCHDDRTRPAELCTLPMYDPHREIPRGKRVDIPTFPRPEMGRDEGA